MTLSPSTPASRHILAGRDDSLRAATTKWRIFLTSCFEARLPLVRFEATAKLLYRTHKVPSSKLSDVLRDVHMDTGASIDPLLPSYIAILLKLDILYAPSLVAAVLKSLRARKGTPGEADVADYDSALSKNSSQLELCLLNAAIQHCQSHGFPRSKQGTMVLLKQIKILLSSLSQPGATEAAKVSDLQPQDADAAAMVVAAGNWTVTVFESAGIAAEVHDVLLDDEIARDLADVFIGFSQLLNQHAPQLSGRLAFSVQSCTKLHEAMEVIRDKQVAQLSVPELQAQVADVPSVHARASLVVYLDALLCCCPTIDQNVLIAHLQARYKGDINRASIDLVLAGFDLLVLQANRGDSEDHAFAARSFIVNKLPLLLLSISSVAILPLSMPMVLQQALGRVDTTVPQRTAFMTACAVHSLIAEDDIKRITGIRVPAHQAGAQAHQATLLQQYEANSQVIDKFVAALELLDGNASAYAETIVDILQNHCVERHTMPLKTICHSLVSNPHRLDAIAVMVGVDRLINPICQLLAAWPQDADHSESHAVYDEFGACFLLVIACVRRFGLELDTDATRFIAEIMSINDRPRKHDDLDEAQKAYLNEWIKALYEDEGISDELMSTCPPQEFYKIVGTLFRVSLNAYKNGALSKDKFHSGLELLLEPFLLPSILCVCPWLAKHAWETTDGNEGLSIILRELVKPNHDPSSTRNIILSLAGSDIDDALSRSYGSAQQDSLTILKSLLAPYLHYERGNAVSSDALSLGLDLTALTPNDIDIKLTFNSLCAWSAGISQVIPIYSHQQLLDVQRRDGAPALLVQFIECIVSQATTGLSDFALDLASATICALSHGRHASNKTADRTDSALQDALRVKLSQTPSFARREPLQAQIIIRLSRRLEAELTHAIPLDLEMPLALTNMMDPIEPVNSLQPLEMPTATEQVMDLPQLELPPLETIPEPLAMPAMFDGTNDLFDLDMEAALAVQDTSGQDFSALPASADDDIFAGLTFDTDMDFS